MIGAVEPHTDVLPVHPLLAGEGDDLGGAGRRGGVWKATFSGLFFALEGDPWGVVEAGGVKFMCEGSESLAVKVCMSRARRETRGSSRDTQF